MRTIIVFLITVLIQMISSISFSQQKTNIIVLQPGPSQGTDADIRTDLPNTPNGSSYDFIANAWTAQGNYFNQRSLLKFDLSEVPANAIILNATLFLYTNLNTGHYQLDSGANAAYLLRAIEAWDENTVDWENQPQVDFNNPVIIPPSTNNTENYELDVTAHIMDMVLHPESNYGWSFRLQTEEMYRCMVFASSDNPMETWRPKLIIQYITCLPPKARFSYTASFLDVSFTDLSDTAYYWHWDFGDETSSTMQNPVHTYSDPGKYRVRLFIGDSCGTSSFCDTVMVDCPLPKVGFTYAINTYTVSFSDTSQILYPLSRLWDFNDGTISTEQNPTHKFVPGHIYNVCLYLTNECGKGSACDSIQIFEPLKLNYTSTQNESENLEVAFTNNTTGASWWHWDFGDGDTAAICNPVHVFKAYGTYNICLTAGNASEQVMECNDLTIKRISIRANDKNITIYPNPCNRSESLSFILFEDYDLVEIKTIDHTGRTLISQNFRTVKSNEPVEIDLSSLRRGAYFLKCTFGNYTRMMKVILL